MSTTQTFNYDDNDKACARYCINPNLPLPDAVVDYIMEHLLHVECSTTPVGPSVTCRTALQQTPARSIGILTFKATDDTFGLRTLSLADVLDEWYSHTQEKNSKRINEACEVLHRFEQVRNVGLQAIQYVDASLCLESEWVPMLPDQLTARIVYKETGWVLTVSLYKKATVLILSSGRKPEVSILLPESSFDCMEVLLNEIINAATVQQNRLANEFVLQMNAYMKRAECR